MRLRPFTDHNPKCLIQVQGKTILEQQIENLLHCQLNDIVITVGPFEEKIRQLVKDKFPTLSVTYVKNHKYETTNNIYSLWLTKNIIKGDIVLLHGDMVFDKVLLERLLACEYATCVLVNNKITPPEKDFKADIRDNLVKRIDVHVSGTAYFLPPIYRFSYADFMRWTSEMEIMLNNGEVNAYAEYAFNRISNEINLHPVYYSDEFCMEIDTFEDVEAAKNFKRVLNKTSFQ